MILSNPLISLSLLLCLFILSIPHYFSILLPICLCFCLSSLFTYKYLSTSLSLSLFSVPIYSPQSVDGQNERFEIFKSRDHEMLRSPRKSHPFLQCAKQCLQRSMPDFNVYNVYVFSFDFIWFQGLSEQMDGQTGRQTNRERPIDRQRRGWMDRKKGNRDLNKLGGWLAAYRSW